MKSSAPENEFDFPRKFVVRNRARTNGRPTPGPIIDASTERNVDNVEVKDSKSFIQVWKVSYIWSINFFFVTSLIHL